MTIKVAICYWGITRSLKRVVASHEQHLFSVLRKAGIAYQVFMHTWKTDDHYVWGDKVVGPIDYTDYQCVDPDYYRLDKQDVFLSQLRFSDYFDAELYRQYGGDSEHEWRPELIRNHLCALESMRRVTELVRSYSFDADYVLYIRPDALLNRDLPLSCFSGDAISLPNWGHYEGYNDRFAVMPFSKCFVYGFRIEEIVEFRNERGRIVSEKFVKYIVDKYFDGNIQFVDFNFDLIRP